MPRYYNDDNRPTAERCFEDINLGRIVYTSMNTGFTSRAVLMLPAEPVEVEPIRPAPIVHAASENEAHEYVWYNMGRWWSPYTVIAHGKNFILGFTEENNFLTKVMWGLLFCLFTLPAFSQFPSFIAGERDGLQYTLDNDLLCLYQVESKTEVGLLLTLDVAVWDNNGFTTEVTPRFDPTKEPAVLIRWVSFYHATDPETQTQYRLALYFEWRANGTPTITKVDIKGGFPRPK